MTTRARAFAASPIEELFARDCRAVKLPDPEREHVFAKPRRWRFDFAWPQYKLAVEIEGGIWTGGRHTRGAGFMSDCEKYNTAAMLGWRVLRFTGDHVKSGYALGVVEDALAAEATP